MLLIEVLGNCRLLFSPTCKQLSPGIDFELHIKYKEMTVFSQKINCSEGIRDMLYFVQPHCEEKIVVSLV